MKAAWIPVAIVALLGLAACGGGGPSYPARATVQGPLVEGNDPAKGVWLFRPAGKPRSVVIFFHGQGGPEEATPVNHRDWIDHMVKEGTVVIYPRYEQDFAASVLGAAIAGVRTANERLGKPDLPVLAIGYSRGGALAVEYAAASAGEQVPVPEMVESINTVSRGEQSRLTDLRPLRHDTVLSIIASDQDELGVQGARLLLRRLHGAGFPGKQIQLHFAHSHGSFVADHLAPLGGSPAAHKAYWAPTDALLRQLSA
jgi:dienelactone hydrolase